MIDGAAVLAIVRRATGRGRRAADDRHDRFGAVTTTDTDTDALRPMWVCPACGGAYVNANNWHSCRTMSLDEHFVGKGRARELFDAYLAAVAAFGPVTLDVKKTGIAFMTRVRFGGCKVRRDRLRAGVWLKRQIASPRFVRVEFIPPDNWIYEFDVRAVGDLDDEALGWLREAYAVGEQRHPRQRARYRAATPTS